MVRKKKKFYQLIYGKWLMKLQMRISKVRKKFHLELVLKNKILQRKTKIKYHIRTLEISNNKIIIYKVKQTKI